MIVKYRFLVLPDTLNFQGMVIWNYIFRQHPRQYCCAPVFEIFAKAKEQKNKPSLLSRASLVGQMTKNRDLGSIPGSGRSAGEGNVSPLQYSCLENSMDRGAWWATTVQGIANSQTLLSGSHTHTHLSLRLPCSEHFFSTKVALEGVP